MPESRVAKYSNTEQYSTAGSPAFWIGQNARGKWARKNAAAISPLAMNATQGVKSPNAMRAPPTNSMTPATPSRENRATLCP